jgi:hypothetical protein
MLSSRTTYNTKPHPLTKTLTPSWSLISSSFLLYIYEYRRKRSSSLDYSINTRSYIRTYRTVLQPAEFEVENQSHGADSIHSMTIAYQ